MTPASAATERNVTPSKPSLAATRIRARQSASRPSPLGMRGVRDFGRLPFALRSCAVPRAGLATHAVYVSPRRVHGSMVHGTNLTDVQQMGRVAGLVSTKTAALYPLDPVTVEEIERVVAAARAALPSGLRFVSVTLREPSKAALANWPASSITREAEVVVLSPSE